MLVFISREDYAARVTLSLSCTEEWYVIGLVKSKTDPSNLSSFIIYNATKILSQLQKIKTNRLEKAISFLNPNVEEMSDLASEIRHRSGMAPDHAVNHLIVDEKTLDWYDSSSDSLSHLNKVAQWKGKKIENNDTPTKVDTVMLLCVNADLMEQVANGHISKPIIMIDQGYNIWDESVRRRPSLS
ncbi:hypothetical protein BLNAU_23453 [Blattamonas nauphoetae]|uniref:Uncharacterized protein n=1 Tax=Blattamonas nauphoetae TaxID=2049346 RepID=A0ABQ9WQ71_9EUKA|nr:hypothetical protein BLNAU_23453 [Blattamonas nauphoetae]